MKKSIFILLLLLISYTEASAQARWAFELYGGEVYNVPMPLLIRQKGFPDIKLLARYRTNPFTPPVYWDWRLCRWQNGKSWEFEAIHHKLYLDNTTSAVQKFNISHGFNILTVNRGFNKKSFQYHAGVGIVLTHPESHIRGKEFGDAANDFDLGYYFSGPVLNFSIGKSYRLSSRFYLNTEAKTTIAYAYIKVAEGHANVYSLAFHIILGFGVNLTKPREK